jgi:hypothetical protein
MSEESKHTAPVARNDEPLSEEALALVAGGVGEGGATPPVVQTVTHISVEITPSTPSVSSLERG